MYFGPNIKFLRKRRGLTQEDVAGSLNLTRSTLNNYENLVAQPGMETLVSFSDFYRIAIDTLIRPPPHATRHYAGRCSIGLLPGRECSPEVIRRFDPFVVRVVPPLSELAKQKQCIIFRILNDEDTKRLLHGTPHSLEQQPVNRRLAVADTPLFKAAGLLRMVL